MNTQLVHPSRLRRQFDHRPVLTGGQGAIAAGGALRARRIEIHDPHIAFAADLFATQGRGDPAGPGLRRGRDQRQIGLLELAHLHRLAEETGGGLGLGGQNDARCVAVQTVHQLGPLAVGSGEGPQQVVQRMRLNAAALTGQTRGLVEGDQMRVFMHHPGADGDDLFFGQGNGLAGLHPPAPRAHCSAPAHKPSAPAWRSGQRQRR